jgi:hypothetical protein
MDYDLAVVKLDSVKDFAYVTPPPGSFSPRSERVSNPGLRRESQAL